MCTSSFYTVGPPEIYLSPVGNMKKQLLSDLRSHNLFETAAMSGWAPANILSMLLRGETGAVFSRAQNSFINRFKTNQGPRNAS